MTAYYNEYKRWMDNPALSEEEWNELNAIAADDKEIQAFTFHSSAALRIGKVLRPLFICGVGRHVLHVDLLAFGGSEESLRR